MHPTLPIVLALMAASASLAPTLSADIVVSAPIPLDPGVRYHDWGKPYSCKIEQSGDTLAFFAGQIDLEPTRGYFRTLAGESYPVDRNVVLGHGTMKDVLWEDETVLLVETSRAGAFREIHLSRYPLEDYARPLQSVLLSRGPTDGRNTLHTSPVIGKVGDRIVAAWSYVLMQIQVYEADLTPVDRGESALQYASLPSVALATREDGALVAWIDHEWISFELLDAHAERVDPPPAPLDLAIEPRQVALAAFRDGWILAAAGPSERRSSDIVVLILDRAGRITALNSISHRDASLGLVLAPGDDTTLLAWRGESIEAIRIDAEGNFLEEKPLELGWGDWSYWEQSEGFWRKLDATWTGSHFVVAWNNYLDPDGPPCELDDRHEVFYVQARWVSEEGDVVGAEPKIVNHVYRPRDAWPHAAGNGFGVLMSDKTTGGYQHLLVDAGTGAMAPVLRQGNNMGVPLQPSAISSGCGYSRFHKLVRTGSSGLFVAFEYSEDWYGYHRFIDARQLDEQGDLKRVYAREIHEHHSWELSADELSLWLADSERKEEERSARVTRIDLVDGSGQVWEIGSPHASGLAVATTNSGCVLVWADTRDNWEGPETHLWTAFVEPGVTPSPVIGRRLFAGFETAGASKRLISTPWGALGVLGIPDSVGSDVSTIYALRFDHTGVPLDRVPLALSEANTHAEIDAVAGPDQHFVVWGECNDNGPGQLMARRISPRGRLVDHEPLMLLDGVSSGFHLAGAPDGTIGLTYGENQFRTISSPLLPILLSDLSAEATSAGIELSWTVHVEGFEHFDVWRSQVGSGQEHETRVNEVPILPTLGRMSLVDREIKSTSRAREVLYFIAGTLPSGEVQRFGPVSVESGLETALQLSVSPNPAASEFIVDFALPARRATWIELLDSGGRRIASERLGEIGAGRHVLRWPPADARIESGAYWVRLAWGGESRIVPLRVVR